MNALVTWTDKQLALIQRTVARDCNEDEFNLFIHTCRHMGLDPLRKQCFAFVFNKNPKSKKPRQMTIVTSISGYRTIADRTGNYRPDVEKARLVIDEAKVNEDVNPLGIVSAEVTVFKFAHGAWFPAIGEAYWDEYAPIRDRMEKDGTDEDGNPIWKPTGKRYLDPKKDGWRKMPRVMIAKCAEAAALRKAWPDDFANTNIEEEIDRSHTIDLSAWEAAEEAKRSERLDMIGGKGAVTIDWMDGEPLQRVPTGKFGDAAMAFIRAHMKPGEEEVSVVLQWRDRNRHSINEYWALDKDGALTLKTELEKVEAMLKAPAKQEAA
jgi:phage recombination protein Bet